MNMKTRAATVVTGVLFASGSYVVGSASAGSYDPPRTPHWMTRACKSEDSVNCFWNVKEQGNGSGFSYFVREMPGPKGKQITCVFYSTRVRWDYCS